MNARPPFGHALLLALTAGATTWVALTAWRGFLIRSAEFLVPVAVVVVVVALVGAVLRWLGSPSVVTVLTQVLATVVVVSADLGGGPVPVGGTGSEIGRAVSDAVTSAGTYAAPIGADVPSVAPLLVVGGAVFVLLVDLLACTLRRVPLAGLALLAVYSIPAGVVQTGPGWLGFLGAAAGFLTMLHLDARDRLLRWGRSLGPDERDPFSDANPLAEAFRVGAGRIGATATAVALVAAPLVPVLDLDVLGLGPGDGDDEIRIQKPVADMRRDLERGEDIPLLQVTTDDPDPDYLRISVLNRFTGLEWSSGDRTVAGGQEADGALPEPTGVSEAVPRTTYDYEVDVTSQLEASWLPTQFPASAVVAEGDWRYDETTMDFLAVPEDLTTAGLSYSMTALELDYGTTGSFFRDASPDQVDSEFLEIPGGLPSIIRSLAIDVTEGATDDYDKALLLQRWFREDGGFEYSLKKAPEGTGGATLDDFLSTEEGGRVGYCEQFASAMAVMARILDVPARVAVGFLNPRPVGTNTWEYSSHDLHAWPELFFDGAGWVRFEPTPADRADQAPSYTQVPVQGPADVPSGNATDDLPDRQDTADPGQEESSTAPVEEAAPEAAGTSTDAGTDWSAVVAWLAAAVLVLALLAALLTAPRVIRARVRRRRLAGGPDDLWAELRATAVDLGVPWPDGRSPRQVGSVLLEHLGDRDDPAPAVRPRRGAEADPDASRALGRLVVAVERARYARDAGPADGAAGGAAGGLADDAAACIASLGAGVPRRALTTATWWPRSLWSPAGQSPTFVSGAEDRPVGTR